MCSRSVIDTIAAHAVPQVPASLCVLFPQVRRSESVGDGVEVVGVHFDVIHHFAEVAIGEFAIEAVDECDSFFAGDVSIADFL